MLSTLDPLYRARVANVLRLRHPRYRIAVSSLVAVALAGDVAAAQRASAPILTLAVENAAFPWSGRDGSGLANDIVRAALAAAGMEVRLDVVPYARCKRMVASGEVAGCFSMSREAATQAGVVFPSIPVLTCRSEVVVRRGQTVRIMRSGSGHRDRAAPTARPAPDVPRHSRRVLVVGVVLGYEYPSELARLEQQGLIELTRATSEEINLRRVADGRIDAAVINVNGTKSAALMAARAGVEGRIESTRVLGELASYIGFSRTHPDGARALAAYETGMRRIAGNGELARIERRWRDRLSREAVR